VKRLSEVTLSDRVSLINAPPKSGKTTLLYLFAMYIKPIKFTLLSFNSPKTTYELIKSAGIDMENSICSIPTDEPFFIFIDDAHMKYDDKGFWIEFLVFSDWISPSIRFIISSSKTYDAKPETILYYNFPKGLTARDMALDQDEYKELIKSRIGLPSYPDNIKQSVFDKSGGIIGEFLEEVERVKLQSDPDQVSENLHCLYLK
jgi:hypothetical protein